MVAFLATCGWAARHARCDGRELSHPISLQSAWRSCIVVLPTVARYWMGRPGPDSFLPEAKALNVLIPWCTDCRLSLPVCSSPFFFYVSEDFFPITYCPCFSFGFFSLSPSPFYPTFPSHLLSSLFPFSFSFFLWSLFLLLIFRLFGCIRQPGLVRPRCYPLPLSIGDERAQIALVC